MEEDNRIGQKDGENERAERRKRGKGRENENKKEKREGEQKRVERRITGKGRE